MMAEGGNCNSSPDMLPASPVVTPTPLVEPLQRHPNDGRETESLDPQFSCLEHGTTHTQSATSSFGAWISGGWSKIWGGHPPPEPSNSVESKRHLESDDQHCLSNVEMQPRRREEESKKILELEQTLNSMDKKLKQKKRDMEVKVNHEKEKVKAKDTRINALNKIISALQKQSKAKDDEIKGKDDVIASQSRELDLQREKLTEQEKKIAELEDELQEYQSLTTQQRELLGMVNPMDDISRQYDGQHDQLIKEYNELMTNPDGALGQLEGEFEDPLDAEVALGHIVMAAYKESKKQVIDCASKRLQKLFVVQNEEGTEHSREMKDLSRAFGLLLPAATNSRSQLTSSNIFSDICEVIQRTMPEMEPYKRAKKNLEGFPVESVVQLTWKFVTTPKPIIVCQPADFNPHIHEKSHALWSDEKQQPYQLHYVRPVVYRDYDGSVGKKGFVGN